LCQGNTGSIATVAFPVFEAKYLVESEKEYPVSFNGKMRFRWFYLLIQGTNQRNCYERRKNHQTIRRQNAK
jgi:hypothetical protein